MYVDEGSDCPSGATPGGRHMDTFMEEGPFNQLELYIHSVCNAATSSSLDGRKIDLTFPVMSDVRQSVRPTPPITLLLFAHLPTSTHG